MCFVSVMLIPVTYYFAIPLWLCRKWVERLQFWAGCAMYILCGPFINISVLTYATIYMDSFGWGKTRKVIADESSNLLQSETELERLERGEKYEASDATSSDLGPDEKPATPTPSDNIVRSGSAGTEVIRDVGAEEKAIGS